MSLWVPAAIDLPDAPSTASPQNARAFFPFSRPAFVVVVVVLLLLLLLLLLLSHLATLPAAATAAPAYEGGLLAFQTFTLNVTM